MAMMICCACPSRTMCRSVLKSLSWVDADVDQSALVCLFSPIHCMRPFVAQDVLMVVLWLGRSAGEGFYPLLGECVFRGPVG